MSQATTPHPLNDTHCACLDKVIQSTTNALQLARDCHECGLDMTDFISGLEAQQQLAKKLKAKFFPARP